MIEQTHQNRWLDKSDAVRQRRRRLPLAKYPIPPEWSHQVPAPQAPHGLPPHPVPSHPSPVNPRAIGRTKCAPSLSTSARAKFTAMRFDGKARPINDKAARTRPRDSATALSANPTTAIAGKPFAICTCLNQCMHLILPKDNPKRGCVWQALRQVSRIFVFSNRYSY